MSHAPSTRDLITAIMIGACATATPLGDVTEILGVERNVASAYARVATCSSVRVLHAPKGDVGSIVAMPGVLGLGDCRHVGEAHHSWREMSGSMVGKVDHLPEGWTSGLMDTGASCLFFRGEWGCSAASEYGSIVSKQSRIANNRDY